MRIIKIALFGLLLLFAFKNRAQIHFPFASRTPEQQQKLEREIDFKKRIIADIQGMAKGSAAGTVIGRTACGANIIVKQSVQPQMQAEINRIQGEINDLERKLQEARQIPSETR